MMESISDHVALFWIAFSLGNASVVIVTIAGLALGAAYAAWVERLISE